MKTFKEFIIESRQPIDWNSNYGKTFKIVHTPEGRQSSGEWNPDLVSVVTPENGDAWTDWKEVSSTLLAQWKAKWNQIQKSLGQHKYDQIIKSQKKLNESVLLELFQSIPNIDTTSNWEILDIDDYDPEGGLKATEVKYYVEIPNKNGQNVTYEFAASIGSRKPGKELSDNEKTSLSKMHIEHLPAAEVVFKTLNHPTFGDSISMVGDANVSQVLNHAMAFIKDIINKFKLNLVSFSAAGKRVKPKVEFNPRANLSRELESESRAKVYERLIKKFADQLGFTYQRIDTPGTGYGLNIFDSTDFILIRKQTI